MTIQRRSDNQDKVYIPIKLAIQEFRNLYNALKNYPSGNNSKKLDIQDLITSKSIDEVLTSKGIKKDAMFMFISALARADKSYVDILEAPGHQEKRPPKRQKPN